MDNQNPLDGQSAAPLGAENTPPVQPMMDGQAAPAPSTTPVNPAAPAPSTTPVNPATPLVANKPKNKGLIIGVICAVVAVILIVCGIVFIPMLLAVDYEDSYEKSYAAYDAMGKLSYDDCGTLDIYISSSSKSKSAYKTIADACAEDIETFDKAFNDFANSSAAKRDDDVKEHFNKAKEKYDGIKESLKTYPAYATDVHTFILDVKNFTDDLSKNSSFDVSDSEINNATSALTDSEFDSLKKIGETLNKEIKAYITAARKYNEASEAYSANYSTEAYNAYKVARDAYYDAEEKFEDSLSNIEDDIEKDFGDDFDDTLDTIYEELKQVDDICLQKS